MLHEQIARTDVVLINSPFGPASQPSIGLSLVRAALPVNVTSSEIFYFNIDFAELIGASLYARIANGFPDVTTLVGEWLFAAEVFGTDDERAENYFSAILTPDLLSIAKLSQECIEQFITDLRRIRGLIPAFLGRCADKVLGRNPAIVGFTSTFQQNLASIALARRLKVGSPETLIVIGGANCEGIMGAELLRQFDCVDAVVSGEGEVAFPELVRLWLADRTLPTALTGVVTRANAQRPAAQLILANASSVKHMDDLPVPDYTDFLEQWSLSALSQASKPVLLFESSRGCWWGERSHCTFCGLNGGNMAFRSKSQTRAITELLQLVIVAERNKVDTIAAVDNILDMKYFSQFVPALAEAKPKLGLFYEVKANLRKDQVKMLQQAGITRLQPGIESLSTAVLSLMRKGVRGIQNIQLLKFCKEFSVLAEWNLLFGFPGERFEDYAAMISMIPSLSHLRPPEGAFQIRLDRFSPNFDRCEEIGLVDVAPFPAYKYVYSISEDAIHNIAYFFTYNYQDPLDLDLYEAQLQDTIGLWKEEYETAELLWRDYGNRLKIIDTRMIAHSLVSEFTGLARSILLFCDSMRSFNEIRTYVENDCDENGDESQIRDVLMYLQKEQLIICEGSLYLSLALRLGSFPLSRRMVSYFEAHI